MKIGGMYKWMGAVLALWLSYGALPVHADVLGEVSALNMPPGWTWPPSAPMQARGARCLSALEEAGVAYERVAMVEGRIATPVRVPSMRFGALEVKSVRTDKPLIMDCELALTFVRQADALVALGVRTLLVGRIYHTRRAVLRGRETNLLSRHALGLGVDVRGFLTRRGQRLTVRRDYARPFVRDVERVLRDGKLFRAVVTPADDRAHRDHFHLSARMTIDDAEPDLDVDLRALARVARQR